MNSNNDCQWDDKHDDDGAQKTDANVDGPALLPSIGSKRARRAPPNPPPHNLPPSFPTRQYLSFLHLCRLVALVLVPRRRDMSVRPVWSSCTCKSCQLHALLLPVEYGLLCHLGQRLCQRGDSLFVSVFLLVLVVCWVASLGCVSQRSGVHLGWLVRVWLRFHPRGRRSDLAGHDRGHICIRGILVSQVQGLFRCGLWVWLYRLVCAHLWGQLRFALFFIGFVVVKELPGRVHCGVEGCYRNVMGFGVEQCAVLSFVVCS